MTRRVARTDEAFDTPVGGSIAAEVIAGPGNELRLMSAPRRADGSIRNRDRPSRRRHCRPRCRRPAHSRGGGGGGRLLLVGRGCCAPRPAWGAGRLRIDFIDVGQGDAALVTSPTGKTVLIDGGPRKSSEALAAFLHAHARGPLDLIVLTHRHEDHLGGLRGGGHRDGRAPCSWTRRSRTPRRELRGADAGAGRARDRGAPGDARPDDRSRRRRDDDAAGAARAADRRVALGREREQRGGAADVRPVRGAVHGRRRDADGDVAAGVRGRRCARRC